MELPVSWDEIVEKLTAKQDLSDLQITWAMAQILDGLATNDQIKNFLILLKAKGEKPSEVRALVDVMYQRGIAIDIPDRAVDIVGTGEMAHLLSISQQLLPSSQLLQAQEQLSMATAQLVQRVEQQIY